MFAYARDMRRTSYAMSQGESIAHNIPRFTRTYQSCVRVTEIDVSPQMLVKSCQELSYFLTRRRRVRWSSSK